MPCFFAHLWLMTLVQAINAATIISVGVGAHVGAFALLGLIDDRLDVAEISVREWVRQLPRIRCVTVVFSFTVTMTLLLSYYPSSSASDMTSSATPDPPTGSVTP